MESHEVHEAVAKPTLVKVAGWYFDELHCRCVRMVRSQNRYEIILC